MKTWTEKTPQYTRSAALNGPASRRLSSLFEKKKLFLFFIPVVQLDFFFKTSAEMKGGKMESILDEVKP